MAQEGSGHDPQGFEDTEAHERESMQPADDISDEGPATSLGLMIWQYEAAAHRTISPECKADLDKCLLNAVLGLVGEAGEVADHVKKHLFHKHTLDLSHLEKEAGDILWYIAQLCYAICTPMADVADGNIAKLLKRYPDGFSSERSLSRLDMVEVPLEEEPPLHITCGAEINLNLRNHVCDLPDGHEGDHRCAGVAQDACNATWPRENLDVIKTGVKTDKTMCRNVKPGTALICGRPNGHYGQHQTWDNGPRAWPNKERP